ncbi:MAG TPA: hypothetical protein PKE29_06225 [Phycisphaerales bacterium]|nr:hypothetical protein [Phycisphaerales bacterium]
MGVPDQIEFVMDPDGSDPTVVVPVSGRSDWVVAIPAGGLETQDQPSGTVIRRATDIFANFSIRNLLDRKYPGTGTTLRVRMRYQADDGTLINPVIIRIFASVGDDPTDPATPFVALPNTANECSVPIRNNADTDSLVGPGTGFAYTTPDNDQHSWDCDGYTWFIIGVEQAYDGDTPEEAWLEAKIV